MGEVDRVARRAELLDRVGQDEDALHALVVRWLGPVVVPADLTLRQVQVLALVRSSPDLTGQELARLLGVEMARNDSWSSLGVVASVAAYTHGDGWLAALIERLDGQRALLADLLAEHLPEARMRPLEGTYLAWLDLRAYGHADPAAVALEKGRVRLAPGHDYHPGVDGHVRLNIATSPERLTRIIERVAGALLP